MIRLTDARGKEGVWAASLFDLLTLQNRCLQDQVRQLEDVLVQLRPPEDAVLLALDDQPQVIVGPEAGPQPSNPAHAAHIPGSGPRW
jgi:hypothetical protein